MGLDAHEPQEIDPASQENKAQEAGCNVEGGDDAGGQVELVHDDAEDGGDDCPRQHGPELHMPNTWLPTWGKLLDGNTDVACWEGKLA